MIVKKKTIIALVAPAFLAGTFFGSPIASATTSYVQALIGTSSIYANGNLVSNPPKLTYGGTTYVQLYSIQQGLKDSGIPSTWDGNDLSLTIPLEPPAPTNDVVFLSNVQPLTQAVPQWNWGETTSSFKDNEGNTYTEGGLQVENYGGGSSQDYIHSTYLLNGQYTKLVGTIAPSSEFSHGAPDPNIGRLQIFGDGRLIYDSQSVASDIMKPIQVSVDVSGVTKLQINLDNGDDQTDGWLGFVNAELIK